MSPSNQTAGSGTLADSRILRLALPLALMVLVLAWVIPYYPSNDLWWHLRTGSYIAETHSVPHADPFSFTAAGRPWVAHEWLAELVMYQSYLLGGLPSLILLLGGLNALALWLVYRRCPREHFWTTAAAMGLGVWTALPTFVARPQAFSLLLASAFLFFLERYRATHRTAPLIALPVLTLFWVNVHGAFLLGPVLVILTLAGSALDFAWKREDFDTLRQEIRELGLAFLGCMVVVPLNPNGWRMFSYPFETLNSPFMQNYLIEWRSPDFHAPVFYPLTVLLFGTVAVMVLSRERPRPSELLLFAVFAYGALRSMRNIALFVLVAVPVLARYGTLPRRQAQLNPLTVQIARLVLLLGALALATQHITGGMAIQGQLERDRFPARAATFVQKNQLPGQIFNTYDFGGYLMWRLYPQYKVYVDGRPDMYGEKFLQDFLHLYSVDVDPQPAFEQQGIRTVIVEPGSKMAYFLHSQSGWKIVYEDNVAVVITR